MLPEFCVSLNRSYQSIEVRPEILNLGNVVGNTLQRILRNMVIINEEASVDCAYLSLLPLPDNAPVRDIVRRAQFDRRKYRHMTDILCHYFYLAGVDAGSTSLESVAPVLLEKLRASVSNWRSDETCFREVLKDVAINPRSLLEELGQQPDDDDGL